VIAPNSDGEWKEVAQKDDIEKALCDENEQRFNQARCTTFLQPPLFDTVRAMGFNQGAVEILNRRYIIPEGTEYWAAKLIPQLARHQAVIAGSATVLQQVVSLDSHCQGWKKAKEFTSAGPSGIMFAQFKAGALDPIIADLEAKMTSIPYQFGISPARWQKGTNVMLEKQKGTFRVDKLRAILLYEADFNQNNMRPKT
jgi:hypothetical protein